MAGAEQGNFKKEDFIEEVNMSAFTTVTLKTSKTKPKRLTPGKKSWRTLIHRRRRRRSIYASYGNQPLLIT